MNDKKTVWICPLCTRTYRTLESFNEHLLDKAARIEQALKRPERHSRTVGQGAEAEQ